MSGTYYLDFSDKRKVITDFYKVAIYNQSLKVFEDGSEELCESKFEDITDRIDRIEVMTANCKKSSKDISNKFAYMIVGYKKGVMHDLVPEGKIARKIAYDRVWCDGQVRLLYRIYIIDLQAL